jgi:ribosomal protein S19
MIINGVTFKDESTVQQEVQINARSYACTLMRNNSGAFKDSTGRVVRYGLGNISQKHQENIKSSDLIGITSVVITPDMVGKTVGIFTALEVKRSDWSPTKKLDKHEQAQMNFIKWVKSLGGIADFISSVDNLKDIFRK